MRQILSHMRKPIKESRNIEINPYSPANKPTCRISFSNGTRSAPINYTQYHSSLSSIRSARTFALTPPVHLSYPASASALNPSTRARLLRAFSPKIIAEQQNDMGGKYVPLPSATKVGVLRDDVHMRDVVNRKLQKRLLPILFTAALMCYLDRTNLSFAALDMNSDLSFTERNYGIGAGIFFATYASFGVPSSVVVKRIGARVGLPLILIAWGLASGAMALVNNVTDFYLLRLLVGATESGFFPSVIYYLTLWFAEEDMGLSYTIVMTATAVSGIIGGPLAGLIMTYLDGVLGIRSWRWLFIAEAIPTIILAFVMFFYLDANPTSARFLTREEREWLVKRQQSELDKREDQHAVQGLSQALRLPWLWLIIGVWLLYSCGYYGIIFWLPLLLKSVSGMSNVVVGFISAVPYLAAGASMIFVARSSDRLRERRLHLALSALVAAIGFFGASAIHKFFGEQLPLLLLCLSIAAGGVWAMFGPYWGIPTSILSGETAAAGFALINSFGVVGGYLGPFIVGELTAKSGNYNSSLAIFGLFMTVCGGLALCLQPNIGNIVTTHSGTPLNPIEDKAKYTDDSMELGSVLSHSRGR